MQVDAHWRAKYLLNMASAPVLYVTVLHEGREGGSRRSRGTRGSGGTTHGGRLRAAALRKGPARRKASTFVEFVDDRKAVRERSRRANCRRFNLR